ncbi:OB-fold domain-containing protein [Sphingomonas sp.]|uniref:Zn-ribbon domain-containing OB-fold protein n=1 Tax=Sphingomonas sp. TaxID=28214 RepID=UPI000DB78CA2|nr:OB-fold domain-containing protein [Sphingomonas sp.]PZU06484.1 MAG: DNA-binding protein [Sphingomonas sp.]
MPTLADRTNIVDPPVTAESQVFWDSADTGRFLLKRCPSCGRHNWYPRDPCPFCPSPVTDWVEGAGTATIYTYSHFARAPQPFVAAYVRLEEGPLMMTNIVGCDPGTLAIGQPVTLAFQRSVGGFAVPMFRPAD